MSSTLAGLKPLILQSFIENTQFVTVDDTDTMPLCKKTPNNKNKNKQNMHQNNVIMFYISKQIKLYMTIPTSIFTCQ